MIRVISRVFVGLAGEDHRGEYVAEEEAFGHQEENALHPRCIGCYTRCHVICTKPARYVAGSVVAESISIRHLEIAIVGYKRRTHLGGVEVQFYS